MKKEKDDLQKALKSFEREFGSIFCNSRLADNSLVDVISMNKAKDSVVYDSLKNMFNDDKIDELRKTNNLNNLEPNNVVSLKGEQRKKRGLIYSKNNNKNIVYKAQDNSCAILINKK